MTGEVTQLLKDWGAGDRSALDRLMPLVYGELRRLARGYIWSFARAWLRNELS